MSSSPAARTSGNPEPAITANAAAPASPIQLYCHLRASLTKLVLSTPRSWASRGRSRANRGRDCHFSRLASVNDCTSCLCRVRVPLSGGSFVPCAPLRTPRARAGSRLLARIGCTPSTVRLAPETRHGAREIRALPRHDQTPTRAAALPRLRAGDSDSHHGIGAAVVQKPLIPEPDQALRERGSGGVLARLFERQFRLKHGTAGARHELCRGDRKSVV